MLTNKAEAAVSAGLMEFDCSLPQRWLDDAADRLAAHKGLDTDTAYSLILSKTVWCYDSEMIFGAPHYLCGDLANDMEVCDGD